MGFPLKLQHFSQNSISHQKNRNTTTLQLMVPLFRWRPRLYVRTKMEQPFPRILIVESIFLLNWVIQTRITPRTQIFLLNFQLFSQRTISLQKEGKKGKSALQLMFPACRWRPHPCATTRIEQSLLSYDDLNFFIVSLCKN